MFYASVCLLAFAFVQKRLSTTSITGPMLFTALGLLASSDGLGIIEVDDGDVVDVVDVLFQGTLSLLLFTDAAALHFTSWRRDAAVPGRLLGMGLPLTIGLTAAFAAVLLTDLSIWEAAIIGAITAPTDAALGQAVVSNDRVPDRIRLGLDVESGLNDGISLPFVLIFIGLAEKEEGTGPLVTFVREIGVAVGVGLVVGVVIGGVLVKAVQARWMGTGWSNIAVVATAIIAFIAANALGGSGLLAVFVAGLAYGHTLKGRIERTDILAENLGSGLVQVSFLAFGALVLPRALEDVTWQIVVVSLLALTVARMAAVAMATIGSGLAWPTVTYLGWFGPRGLATVVFAALVVREAELAGINTIIAVAAITVGISVVAHGATAYPGSNAYADWQERHRDAASVEQEPLHAPFRPRGRHSPQLDDHAPGDRVENPGSG
ncbi:MAG: cation:proton antiporter [Acidimicrobiales bacterium]